MNDTPRGPGWIGGDTEDLAAEILYRPISWTKFVKELLKTYEPPLRAAATHRQMEYVLKQVTALTIVGPDGAAVPMVQTTADLTPPVIAELLRTRPRT